MSKHPARGAKIPEAIGMRQVLYGGKPNVYRVIYRIDELGSVVTVLHIRHGRGDAFDPNSA